MSAELEMITYWYKTNVWEWQNIGVLAAEMGLLEQLMNKLTKHGHWKWKRRSEGLVTFVKKGEMEGKSG